MLEINKIHNIDCLEGLKSIDDNSINLEILDLPYNIKKDSWDKINNYENWVMQVIKECERVLKDNGSFYFFHNNMPVIADIMQRIRKETKFVFKQFIVWNKRFDEASNKGFLDGFVEVGGLRNYQKMVEYILYYTFQDETGLTTIFNSKECFQSIKNYLRDERKKAGLTLDDVNNVVGTASMAARYFSDSQWCMPIKERYVKLQSTGFFRREYEDLRREYEDLRREYEDLRYTFNNQKTHHSVWNYEIAERNEYLTTKPKELIKNIILHSSNEGDVVLDPTMGLGTTAYVAKQINRNFIGFETNQDYVELANKRLQQTTLNEVKVGIPPSPKDEGILPTFL